MSVADDQWNEELTPMHGLSLPQYEKQEQSGKAIKPTKHAQDANARKNRAIYKAATKAVKPKPLFSFKRPSTKLADFSAVAARFTLLAAKLKDRKTIEPSQMVALRTLFTKLSQIYAGLTAVDKNSANRSIDDLRAAMAEVSAKFAKTKKSAFANFVGKVDRKLGVTNTVNRFKMSSTGQALLKVNESLKGFTKKTTSFFSSMWQLAKKPFSLSSGGGILDMLGAAIGLAALGTEILLPIVSGVEAYLTKHFGKNYVQGMLKEVWDKAWSFMLKKGAELLGIDKPSIEARRQTNNTRTLAESGMASPAAAAAREAYAKANTAYQADKTPENHAALLEAKGNMESAGGAEMNAVVSHKLKLVNQLLTDSMSVSKVNFFQRSVYRDKIKQELNYIQRVRDANPRAELSPSNKALLETTKSNFDAVHGKGNSYTGLLLRGDANHEYQKGEADKAHAALVGEAPVTSATTMKPPSVVQGGSVTVKPTEEPMETSGGVTAEKPSEPKPSAASPTAKAKTPVAAGLTASAIPTSAVSDNLLLLNSGVLA